MTDPRRRDPIVARVRAALGEADDATASHGTYAALAAFGRAFSPLLCRRAALVLEPDAAAILVHANHHPEPPSAAGIVAHVARVGLTTNWAHEVAVVVGSELGRDLDADAVALAKRELPDEVFRWLVPDEGRPTTDRRAPEAALHNLSGGRPGSAHPLASSSSTARHSHESRISSTHGTRQEAAGDTLARYRPGRARSR